MSLGKKENGKETVCPKPYPFSVFPSPMIKTTQTEKESFFGGNFVVVVAAVPVLVQG